MERCPPPHGNAVSWGGTECERGVFRAERKRERVSAKPIERHQEVAEERVRGAEPCAARRAIDMILQQRVRNHS